MKTRLVILIVLAAGLAIYFAMRTAAPTPEEQQFKPHMTDQERDMYRALQTTLSKRDLPGDEPAEEAEFDIQVEVDPTGKKNRLYYYLTESHGYYAETFDIHFYYRPTPDTEYDDSPLATAHIDQFLNANEVGAGCIEVVPAELVDIGDDIGTSENWSAVVVNYGRARAENPDPLPPFEKAIHCD